MPITQTQANSLLPTLYSEPEVLAYPSCLILFQHSGIKAALRTESGDFASPN